MSESNWLDLIALWLDHRLMSVLVICVLACVLGILALIRASGEEAIAILREIRRFLG